MAKKKNKKERKMYIVSVTVRKRMGQRMSVVAHGFICMGASAQSPE